MSMNRICHFSVTLFLISIIFGLAGCGSDAFNADETPPPENDVIRVPDAAQIPDCGDAVIYDMEGSNGFGLQRISSSVSSPTDIAFIPGSPSAFIVSSQSGIVSFFNGSCIATNTLDLTNVEDGGIGVGTGGEQGLLNIEFHPNYANNGFVFFYHTKKSGTSNAISRMTTTFDGDGNVQFSDSVEIIEFLKNSQTLYHNGGGLVFAADNTLLASVGDASVTANAQSNKNLLGVVARVQPSLTKGMGGYDTPTGNMFDAGNEKCSGTNTSLTPCPEILAMGLRNPFRMSVDGNIVYLGDVGDLIEEINSFDYTRNGANFGWPTHDGFVENLTITNYRNPIIYYDRDDEIADAFRAEDPEGVKTPSATIMIGDVYRGDNYAAAAMGKLFFADFYDGYMRAVSVNNKGAILDMDGVPGEHIKHQNLVSSMLQGPDDFMYITSFADNGVVFRLVRP